ncbi:cysteine dioxygenase family protein [Pelagibius marinus]|uniref:cysteine dioxygenase family protein n=1 Tax=Pelagibius marinus TaxID=2762760 RepID=UPI0018727CF7|nr:cysteine dioxygenase family protein [Pelagibius marinus]
MPSPQAKDQPYTLETYVEDLRRITAETDDEDEIIRRVGPLAQRLAVNKSWLQDKHYVTNAEQGFNAILLHEEPDHSLAVFVANWLPGRGAPPHDHGTWAVVAGIEGVERNTRYARVDDRSRPDYAELEVKNEIDADEGELICMKTGGIHSVRNETDKVTLSLHTYGRHVNHTVRSQYNLETGEKKDFKVHVD